MSTVYTKQHYAIDAIAGAVVGLAGGALFLRPRGDESVSFEDRAVAPGRALFAVGAYLAAVGILWCAYQLGLGPLRS